MCFAFVPSPHSGSRSLSLHDALPISHTVTGKELKFVMQCQRATSHFEGTFSSDSVKAVINSRTDRKSTRLNSSHRCISYAVFFLKNKTYGVDRGKRLDR